MNFASFSVGAARSESPALSSRAASPQPRNARTTQLDDAKIEKATRRYGANLERTLTTWEIAPEEWADYIAFLSRLLKAVQGRPENVNTLPYSSTIASKLAQCLNPNLPSGVHQKALEVYHFIFATFGNDHVSTSLADYLPGLFPLLSFASLSVRPALYALLEDYVAKLDVSHLRPVLKSFILSLLPALEDETSEDFDRALAIIVQLERSFCEDPKDEDAVSEHASFFWQSVYLSVITSPSRRQGALHFLSRRSISFAPTHNKIPTQMTSASLSPQAEAATAPDPGLLIRSFSCGLSDSQTLIQRGFLDLLIATLPLHSVVLQERVRQSDIHMLFNAVLGILLRRDMSLNRRIWQWFLGPETRDENGDIVNDGVQADYFATYGMQHLQTYLVEAFRKDVRRPSERARPFRISLSLMDRSELGGQVVPLIFLPALRSAFRYSNQSSKAETTELLKSASLFFDGVESTLIWSNLFNLLTEYLKGIPHSAVADPQPRLDDLQTLEWVLKIFNVREDDMTSIFAPHLALYILATLSEHTSSAAVDVTSLTQVALTLMGITSSKALEDVPRAGQSSSSPALPAGDIAKAARKCFNADEERESFSLPPGYLRGWLFSTSVRLLQNSWGSSASRGLTLAASILTTVLQKAQWVDDPALEQLVVCLEGFVQKQEADQIDFEHLTALINILAMIDASGRRSASEYQDRLLALEPRLTDALLHFVHPAHSVNNIEAVRLLWRLDSVFREEEGVRASLQALLTTQRSTRTHVNAVRTFLNLWTLSATLQPSATKSPMLGMKRRVSGSVAQADIARSSRMLSVLRGPLHVVLDTLDDPHDEALPDISLWLNYSQHAELVVQMLVEDMDTARQAPSALDEHLTIRAAAHASNSVEYALRQISSVLRHAQLAFWIALSETQLTDTLPGSSGLAPLVLAKHCIHLLPGSPTSTSQLHGLALKILGQLLDGPAFIVAQLERLDVRSNIMAHLLACLEPQVAYLQPSMLRVVAKIVRLAPQETIVKPDVPKHSVHVRRISMAASSTTSPQSMPTDAPMPTQPVVHALRQALSTASIQPYLDSWLDFLADVLPTLGEVLATNLIPLTETLCKQVESVLEQVILASKRSGPPSKMYSPESTIVKLLDALEITLRAGHDVLLVDDEPSDTAGAETVSNVLNSVTPNMFKQQSNPSKTTKANTRLTITLSSKDVVRICVRMYVWSSTVAEGGDVDKSRAATISHVAFKLRNRSRHMLEGVFSIDMMETLEVVALSWHQAETTEAKATIIGLLQVLHTTRPKHIIPAILDALCSRTNPSILGTSRQSSLTTDLSSATLALFYSTYLESLEDDALDEVWSDCTAFMRDVLSNPLPYRSILPMLLWIAFQLAEKLDNTNFGERKRMRRELGDNFQRLLTATFTTIPAGSLDTTEDRHNKETSFTAGLRDLNLLVILREIVVRVELLLETSDRVALCINAITTYIVTPTLRSKSFPSRVTADVLALVVRIAKKMPSSKVWRRDVTDAFNDTRFIMTPALMVSRHWFPILQQLVLSDKERMMEILAKLSAPSSAGIMFGVGANAARLDADRKTQLNLRRVALLCLSSSVDGQVEHLRTISEKMVELFEATAVSSPSSVVKAELFMLIRALLLSTKPIHFASLWPIVNVNLRQALLSTTIEASQSTAYNNLTLLQACKLLDLLVALSPEEFQLQEWVFITNTTDAVYHSPDWTPLAATDELAEALGTIQLDEDATLPEKDRTTTSHPEGLRGPLLTGGAGYDTEDIKAISRDVFVSNSLRPFLSQLSIHIYESRYRLEQAELSLFRSALVEDLQDAATIIT